MKANFVSLLATLLCMSLSALAAPTSQPQSQHLAIPLKIQAGIHSNKAIRYGQNNQHGKRDGSAVQIYDYYTRLLGFPTIGTQRICVIFDTGSPQLNLDASAYTPGPTAIKTNKTITTSYGQGETSDVAQIYLDTVQLGSTTTYKVPTLHASQDWFNDGGDCAVGLLGLSFPSIDETSLNIATFLKQYFQQNPGQKQQFAAWIGNVIGPVQGLNESEAMLYLGGYDASKFSGSLTYTNVVVPEAGWWQIPSGGRINGQAVPVVIDSGTPIINAPTLDALQKFATSLNLTVMAEVGSQNAFIPVPCSAEQVTVSFNNLTRKIPHLQPSPGLCQLPVQSYNNNNVTANGNWIFGLPVYEQFFILHDYESKRAGFAIPNK